MILPSNGASNNRDAALHLAEVHGCAVFPCYGVTDGKCDCGRTDCTSQGKHPHYRFAPNGFKCATTDSSFIRAVWGELPNANIGVATGDVSDLLVVDIDGAEGLRAFADWSDHDCNELKEHPQSETGGKGRHLFFRQSAGMKSTSRIDGLPIDLRADGGYVIVPPSINAKGAYSWITSPDDGEFAPAPDWLLDKLPGGKTDGITLEVQYDLRTHPGAAEGERNAVLCRLVGAWLAQHGETADLPQLALDWGNRCKPPYPESEIVKAVTVLLQKHNRTESKAKPTAATRLTLTKYSDVEPQPVEWLWKGRLPLGKLVVLSGDPGLGKTTVLLDFAARVSTGTPFPDGGTCPCGTVIFYTLEDGLRDTMVPRLMAAGGDRGKVFDLGPVERPGIGEDIFQIDRDLPILATAIEQIGDAILIIIDPISAALGDTVNENKNADVRRVLGPLAKLAEQSGVCIIGNSHFGKSPDRKAVHRTLGSIALIAAARAGWAIVEDPDDEDRRLFLPQKNNLAKADGMAFRLKQTVVEGCEVAAIEWEPEPVKNRLDDDPGRSNAFEAFAAAEAFLREHLTEPTAATIIVKNAKLDGISKRTLDRAKKNLLIKSERQGNEWIWHPPPTVCIGKSTESENDANSASKINIATKESAVGNVDSDPETLIL